jgi:Zn-dependent protease with chaperone function
LLSGEVDAAALAERALARARDFEADTTAARVLARYEQLCAGRAAPAR